jgi:hypothetical protein
MRASIVRQALFTVVALVAIGMGLTWIGGGLATMQLGWAVALAVGIAGFTAWQKLAKVRRGFVAATNPDFSLVPVDPAEWPRIDWKAIDDISVQLEARGFERLGDFTASRAPRAARGMARFFSDPERTMVVELQQFERVGAARLPTDELVKVHVAIGSVLGGRVNVMVSDRPITPASYMIRNANAVLASFPGKPVLELVELHRRLVERVAAKSGLALDTGYTLERYVTLQRERQRELRDRLERASTWDLLGEYDRFVAKPVASYAPGDERLKSMQPRGWNEIGSATGAPAVAARGDAPPSPAAEALRARMASGAHWFYWIAGLSAVNALSSAMGSQWGFVVSLGVSEVLSAAARSLAAKSATGLAIAWALNAAAIGLFVLLGWLASRPSVAAIMIGIALFALDTLIFVFARDWIGVAFHAIALYFLVKGLGAAREMKRLASAASPEPATATT